MAGHIIVKCKECDKVIRQCRCPGGEVTYEVCLACKDKLDPNVLTLEKLKRINHRLQMDTKIPEWHHDIALLVLHAMKTLGWDEEPVGRMQRFKNGIEMFVPGRVKK